MRSSFAPSSAEMALSACAVDRDSGLLHLGQDARDRQLDIAEQRLEAVLRQLRHQRLAQRGDQFRLGAGLAIAAERRQVVVVEIGERRFGPARIDQEPGQHRVEVDARKLDAVAALQAPQMLLQIVDALGRSSRAEQRRRRRDARGRQHVGFGFALCAELEARAVGGACRRARFRGAARSTGCWRHR